jgi:signal transduction histidine kinase
MAWLAALFVLADAAIISPRLTDTGLSAFFLPNAILFYALFRAREPVAAAVALFAFVASGIAGGLLSGRPLLPLMPVVALDITEAGAVALAVRRVMAGHLGPRRPRRAFTYIAVTVAAVTVVGALAATVITGFGLLPTGRNWPTTWRDWVLGDLAAYLTLGAVLLMVGRSRWQRVRQRLTRRPGEFIAAAGFLLVAVAYDLWALPGVADLLSGGALPARHLGLVFLTVPAMLWLSLRFHRTGAATGIVLSAVPAVHLVAAGWGPDWPGPMETRVIGVQIYAMVSALVAYLVAALAEQAARRKRLADASVGLALRRAADRADFLAGINHELRTPLNGIAGFAHLMKHEVAGPLPESYRAFATMIEASAARLIAMVERALDVNAVTAPAARPAFTPVDPAAVARETIATVGPLAAARGISLRLSDEGAGPVDAVEGGLGLALGNLLTNAIAAAGPRGSVTVATAAVSGGVEICVTDTGPGFPAGFMLDTNRSMRGDAQAGLGLHLVDMIATMHGGHLSLNNAPGGGGSVRLTIPHRRRPGAIRPVESPDALHREDLP